jgi:hypothetical protein
MKKGLELPLENIHSRLSLYSSGRYGKGTIKTIFVFQIGQICHIVKSVLN